MNFYAKFQEKGKLIQNKRIGIGLGEDIPRAREILSWSLNTVPSIASQILLVGTDQVIQALNSKEGALWTENTSTQVQLYTTTNPSKFLLDNLYHLSTECPIDAVIRGGISSKDFLHAWKQIFPDRNLSFQRLALLESAHHHQFFFAGVGIDEIHSFSQKEDFIRNFLTFMHMLRETPKISILSGGRQGDVGRDHHVDATLEQGEKLVKRILKSFPDVAIRHDAILIEKAHQSRSNFLLPPTGIAGNLIYRTLIHLGNGKSYGAVYLNRFLKERRIIIDCSRVAPDFELTGSLYFALYLVHLPES